RSAVRLVFTVRTRSRACASVLIGSVWVPGLASSPEGETKMVGPVAAAADTVQPAPARTSRVATTIATGPRRVRPPGFGIAPSSLDGWMARRSSDVYPPD